MTVPTQEEYSKLTTEEKFRLAVNAFKATCDVIFETDVEYEISINAVPFRYVGEFSTGKEDKLKRSETESFGVWHWINISEDRKRDLIVSTFKL